MDRADSRNRFAEDIKAFYGTVEPSLRKHFLSGPRMEGSQLTRLLEHHARGFIIDRLMDALGWTTNPTGADPMTMLTEAFFAPGKKHAHTKFLDYLGFDQNATRPLLILEAKRFGALAPSSLLTQYNQTVTPSQQLERVEHVLALAALTPVPAWLTGEWKEHFEQLRTYHAVTKKKFDRGPLVAAIGNGEWLVILKEPDRIFGTVPAPECIKVFEGAGPGKSYLANFEAIHAELSFDRLSEEAPFLPPEWIPAPLRQAKKIELMRGVRIGYTSNSTGLTSMSQPHVEVAPIVFLRFPGQRWIKLAHEGDMAVMPHDRAGAEQLTIHLRDVQAMSDALVKRVKAVLSVAPIELDLSAGLDDKYPVSPRGFVARMQSVGTSQSFALMTGNSSHFLRPASRTACTFHDWRAAREANCAHPAAGPVAHPMVVGERAFFPEGRVHHCAHTGTYHAKSAPVAGSAEIAAGVGPGIADAPYCRIFDFESMLCCQTCVYLETCAAKAEFRLPCMPVPAAAAG